MQEEERSSVNSSLTYKSILQSLNSGRGAYIDANGIRWDTTNADYEGYLNKKSKWLGEWRKRYFVLVGSKIFFAKLPSETPHGMIDLIDCIAVRPADRKAQKNNAFEITLREEFFLLSASTERDRDEWCARIGRSIIKNSGMFIPEQDASQTDSIDGDDES